MDLVINKDFEISCQHKEMLKQIKNDLPMVKKATRNFNKTHSQFFYNVLDNTCLTDLRSARQALAEIQKTKQALDEAYFGIEKKKARIELLQEKNDKLSRIKALELQSQINNSMGYVEGAIRKMAAYIAQYKSILKKYGKDEFTEEDFEKDEERYHIMTAFAQGLHSARAHGGCIDEGNHIYLFQIGISGIAAQAEVSDFLDLERTLIDDGKMPTHQMTLNWLNNLADKYQGCATEYIKKRGLQLTYNESLLNG